MPRHTHVGQEFHQTCTSCTFNKLHNNVASILAYIRHQPTVDLTDYSEVIPLDSYTLHWATSAELPSEIATDLRSTRTHCQQSPNADTHILVEFKINNFNAKLFRSKSSMEYGI